MTTGTHYDSVDLPFAHQGDNLVSSQPGPNNYFTRNTRIPDLLSERSITMQFRARGASEVIIASAGDPTCLLAEGVVCVKEYE